MTIQHLTAETVNRLPFEQEGQVLYRDAKLEGFGLRVGATRKAYFVEKRVDGRTVRHTIGAHGQITADQARKLAQGALFRMASGQDLNAKRRAERMLPREQRELSAKWKRERQAACPMGVALYRHFDANGVLLYVGISNHPIRRLISHEVGARWYEHIAKVDVEWFPDRNAAELAERRAIVSERPKWNKVRYTSNGGDK